MAININPANLGVLGSVSGGGNAQMANAGALGLQSLQASMGQAESLRNNATQNRQIRQQGDIAFGAQRNERQQMANQSDYQKAMMEQQRMGLLQQQQAQQNSLQEQGRQFDVETGLKQQGLDQQQSFGQQDRDAQKEALMQQAHDKEMAKLLDEKRESIHDKGAFASYGLMAMKNAKTPEEANQLRTEMLKEGVDKGFVSKEEAAAALKMPLSQYNTALGYKIMQYGVVKEYRDMQEANAPSGTQLTSIDPDGTKHFSDTTNAVNTEVQKDVKNQAASLDSLSEIKNKFKEDYFKTGFKTGMNISKAAESNSDIPLVGKALDMAAEVATGKDKEGRAADIEKYSAFTNSVDQLFNAYKKEITGSASSDKELQMLKKSFLNGDMSPSEFTGSLDQLVVKYGKASDTNKNILNKGIDTSPSNDGLRQHLKQKGYSDEEINNYLKGQK